MISQNGIRHLSIVPFLTASLILSGSAQGAQSRASRKAANAASKVSADAPSRATQGAGSRRMTEEVGLGVMAGEPTGITAKYWRSPTTALAFGASYSFNSYLGFLVDHHWHFPGAGLSEFVPYAGLGGILFANTSGPESRPSRRGRSRDDAALGVRVPLGVEYLPMATPLGVFIELVPGVGMIPEVFGFAQGEIGARLYL